MGREAALVVPSEPIRFCSAKQHKKLLFETEGCKEGQREAMLEASWAPRMACGDEGLARKPQPCCSSLRCWSPQPKAEETQSKRWDNEEASMNISHLFLAHASLLMSVRAELRTATVT